MRNRRSYFMWRILDQGGEALRSSLADIPTELAIGRSVDFHNGIGSTRKFQRLHYLKEYWSQKAKAIPAVTIQTPSSPKFSGALCVFSIEGMKPADIETELFKKQGIHVIPNDYENINGVRVTPHVYTTLGDLDRLVSGISDLASKAQKKG